MSEKYEQARFMANSVSLVFPRQHTIRRLANEFEDVLHGDYSQPQLLGVPDDFEPEAPRIIFPSINGFSSIVISQVTMAINVNYSDEWQRNIEQGRQYLIKKTKLLFHMFEFIKRTSRNTRPQFLGLVTLAQVKANMSDNDIIAAVAASLGVKIPKQDPHELLHKWTTIHGQQFFNNITVQNYRRWQVPGPAFSLVELRTKDAFERGIQVTGDFNDRYAYQEDNGRYAPSASASEKLINLGIEQVQDALRSFQ